MSKARECYLCGEKYKYCPSCSNDRMKPAWMSQFHKENCKNIFDICTRFNMKLITKSEAQEALINCDLSNHDNFKSYVQRDIAAIFAEDPKPKRNKKATPIVIEEPAVVIDEPAVTIEEPIIEKQIIEEAIEEPNGVVITE